MDLNPLNFKKWIDENRHLLKPPVNNKVVWKNTEFMVMVVGGPNSRSDYHINQSEEFFYQLEGEIHLKIIDDQGKPKKIFIREGEIYLLPPNVPHSPQRGKDTIGLVIERRRREGELDGFAWYCEQCGNKLYEEQLVLTDIVKQLPPIFERFNNKTSVHVCKICQTKFKVLA